ARRTQPAALLLLVMLPLAFWLFHLPNGFSLFKLAMFAQPFLLAVLVLGAWRLVTWPLVRGGALIAPGGAGLASQARYLRASRGVGTAFLEVRDPSGTRLLRQMRRAVAGASVRRLVVDTSNNSLARMLVLYTRGVETTFPALS